MRQQVLLLPLTCKGRAQPYDYQDGNDHGAPVNDHRKGQTTVPRTVRDRIGARPGTRLEWHVMPDGSVIVRAKTHSLLDLVGSLKAPDGKRVPIEDLSGWR